MKKYQIWLIVGNTREHCTVFAENFHTSTNSSTSTGYYAFYCDNQLVACYPIERTVIYSIENAEE
jgi:hypothetical protein